MLRYREAPAFRTSHSYRRGFGPRENHPAQWGKLEVHRHLELLDGAGKPYCAVAVHSTRRSRDGWTYNVAELRERPEWVGYFHNAATGERLMHKGTDGALELQAAFNLHHVL
jgi:hypothetical protein